MDPRQIVLLLDIDDMTPMEEVRGRLPERDVPAEVICAQKDTPDDWLSRADEVCDLVQRLRDRAPAEDQIDLYICGQAPQALFVQLGQELSEWRGPITFLEQHGDLRWDEVLIQPCARGEASFFTVREDLEQLFALAQDQRACVFISTRGVPADASRIRRFLAEQQEPSGPLVQVRTRTFQALERGDGGRVEQELRLVFDMAAGSNRRPPALFIAGSSVLAFLAGRALGRRPALVPEPTAAGYRPGLALPWEIAPPPAQTISVFIAHAASSACRELAKNLADQLRVVPFLSIQDRGDVLPGAAEQEALDALVQTSDIVVAMLSAEFVSSPLGHAADHRAEHRGEVIPVQESRFLIHATPWAKRRVLPAQDRPVDSQTLYEVAEQVHNKAREMLEKRRAQIRSVRPHPIVTTVESGERSIMQQLRQLEAQLIEVPRLRHTVRKRYDLWDGFIDHIDRTQPALRLRDRLGAKSKNEHLHRHMPELQEPEFYLPEDPLGMVLDVLGDEAAGYWLHLGIVYVGPVVPFPLHSLAHREINLIERLKPYQGPGPGEPEIDLVQRLHEAGCSGLLATFLRCPSEEEIEAALASLKSFRSNALRQKANDESARIHHAGVLNILGAERLWCCDLDGAEAAYERALALAHQDQDDLAAWVACCGLHPLYRWRADTWGADPEARETYETRAERIARRRDVLVEKERKNPQALHNRLREAVAEVHKRLAGQLCENLAEGGEEGRPAFGVATHDLEELLLDQEELGLPPMMRGQMAELIGTVRLLQAPLHGQAPLPQTIALLCRYGSDGIGSTFRNFRFFSPALQPAAPDFLPSCQEALQPGRTTGEWQAKLRFLERHGLDMPGSLIPRIHAFYQEALDYFLHDAPRRDRQGWLLYVRGSSFGSSAEWAVIGPLVEYQMVLASAVDDGLSWIVELLQRPEPACFRRVLECLQGVDWADRWRLKMDPPALWEKLGAHLLALLLTDKDTGRGRQVPIGLAALLSTLHQAGVASPIIDGIHERLCQMLSTSLLQDRTTLSLQRFFSPHVRSWLKGRDGSQLASGIDALLRCLSDFHTSSDYFDAFAYVADALPLLSEGHVAELVSTVTSHLEMLLHAVAERDYARHPLAYFAGRVLSATRLADTPLPDMARDLIRHMSPDPSALGGLALAPPRQLAELEVCLEAAVLHCLRGDTYTPLPWFNGHQIRPTTMRHGLHRESFSRSALIQAGLQAAAKRCAFHLDPPPPSGWALWLDAALAHCYAREPELATWAFHVLELAMNKLPDLIHGARAAQVLAWGLTQPDRQVREAALLIVARHEARLLRDPAGPMLTAVLRVHGETDTLSTAWIRRIALLPPSSLDPV